MHQTTVERARKRFGQMYATRAFHPVARFISNKANEEDVLADAVAQTFEMDARCAAKGKVLDPALLVHAAKLRVIDPSRRFVKTDAQPARDVLHQPNFSSGKVKVLHLDGLPDENGEFSGESDRAIEIGLAEAMSHNHASKLNSAIDLLDWLDDLPDVDQDLLSLRFEGFTLGEIAVRVGGTIRAVCRRLHQLGLELAARMGIAIELRHRRSAQVPA